MENLYRFRFYWLALFGILGLAIFPGIKQAIQVDNSLQAWFIEGDPALENYYEFQEYFGNDELVFLLIQADESKLGINDLRKIRELEQSLENHPEVENVISPLDIHLASNNPFAPRGPQWLNLNSFDEERLAKALDEEAFFSQQFFDRERQALKLIIKLRLSEDFETQRANILNDLYAISDRIIKPEQSFFGGLSVIYAAMNDLSQRDFSRFLAIGYLLMFLLIALLYRSWAYIAYALLTIALSTYFTLAIYGLMGHRLNLLSTLIPAIIILLCVMDVMHILNERNRENPDESLKENALNSLKRIWKPCLFTSLSTMAGFLSLAISPVKILANFGIYAALGIGFGLVFSFCLGSIILPLKAAPKKDQESGKRLLQLQNWVLGKQRTVIAGFVILILTAGISISNLKVDTNSIAYLPEDHWVRQDSEQIEHLMGPYMPLEFLLKTKEGYTMQSPEVLQALNAIEEEAENLAHTGDLHGYHDLFKAALQKRYGGDWEEGYTKNSVLKSMATLAERSAPEWVRSFNNEDYTMGRYMLSGELVSAGELAAIIDSMASLNEKHLGEFAEVNVSGYQSLYAEIVNYVTESQVKSLSLAIILVFLLLWLFLKNLRLSLISLLPNLFPILIMLASMALLGIALDTATASIASIVLSFSIDDTMHFIWHYRELKRKGVDLDKARNQTIAHVGRAILFTSAVLFAGYSLMIFGELKTVIYFGLLTAVSILAALLSQFFLFPILLKNYDRPVEAVQID